MLEFFYRQLICPVWWTCFSTVSIPMGTYCAPLHTDLFLHSYGADFIADLLRKKEHHLARSFYLSFRYKDDVLSLKNPSFRI